MSDRRDYTESHSEIEPLVRELANKSRGFTAPPSAVDLRRWCSPIEDQGQLGSCTANAAVGIVEYFERRSHRKHIDGSRLFVYKTTRNLLGVSGDTGAWLRNAMGALVLCGVPHERYWPYTDGPEFDIEPPAFIYKVAGNFAAAKYFAHDAAAASRPPQDVLASVKKYLAAGVPTMFGFWGYVSFDSGDKPGHIPFPTDVELAGGPEWGHAIVAIGYDDARKIKNLVSNRESTGALLIRNSWSKDWGDAGYGWMPYEYVLQGVALDFWSLLNLRWVSDDFFV